LGLTESRGVVVGSSVGVPFSSYVWAAEEFWYYFSRFEFRPGSAMWWVGIANSVSAISYGALFNFLWHHFAYACCFNSLQGLTWILPERFANSEITPEAGAMNDPSFCWNDILVLLRCFGCLKLLSPYICILSHGSCVGLLSCIISYACKCSLLSFKLCASC
jgi:hypothetical protein